MSEAKEGKLLGRKKLLDPHLGTTEGTKITSTIIFYTSHALTVYSIEYFIALCTLVLHIYIVGFTMRRKAISICKCLRTFVTRFSIMTNAYLTMLIS